MIFFTLSKVLGFFIVPTNIMAGLGLAGIALLAIGYVGAGRRMLVASIVLVAAVGVLPIGDGLALPLEARFPRWDAMRGPPIGIIVLSRTSMVLSCAETEATVRARNNGSLSMCLSCESCLFQLDSGRGADLGGN